MFIAALVLITTKVETTQMSINWGIDKQNVLDPDNGIVFNHKKKSSTDPCYSVDEAWKQCAKWKKPDTKGHISYDSIYMKFPEKANPRDNK